MFNIAQHRQTSLNITKHHWPLINQKMKDITKQWWLLMINYQMCQISLNMCTHLCLWDLFQTYLGINMFNYTTHDLKLSLKNLVSEVKMNFHWHSRRSNIQYHSKAKPQLWKWSKLCCYGLAMDIHQLLVTISTSALLL